MVYSNPAVGEVFGWFTALRHREVGDVSYLMRAYAAAANTCYVSNLIVSVDVL